MQTFKWNGIESQLCSSVHTDALPDAPYSDHSNLSRSDTAHLLNRNTKLNKFCALFRLNQSQTKFYLFSFSYDMNYNCFDRYCVYVNASIFNMRPRRTEKPLNQSNSVKPVHRIESDQWPVRFIAKRPHRKWFQSIHVWWPTVAYDWMSA